MRGKKLVDVPLLSQWTTSHGILSPYSSYGHDAAKMPKSLQPLIFFTNITVLGKCRGFRQEESWSARVARSL